MPTLTDHRAMLDLVRELRERAETAERERDGMARMLEAITPVEQAAQGATHHEVAGLWAELVIAPLPEISRVLTAALRERDEAREAMCAYEMAHDAALRDRDEARAYQQRAEQERDEALRLLRVAANVRSRCTFYGCDSFETRIREKPSVVFACDRHGQGDGWRDAEFAADVRRIDELTRGVGS